jgi:tetratricopeptide (TPR) repeat protein
LALAELTVALRAPASLLRMLGGAPLPLPEPDRDRMGLLAVGEGAVAWAPRAGDPAVFDTALAYGSRLLNDAGSHGPLSRDRLRLLVSPAELELVDGRLRETADDLADDLRLAPPTITGGAVWLTAHAAAMLEEAWRLSAQAPYRRRSGKEVPLWKAEGPGESGSPWRNPEVLGRRLAWMPRPETEERLLDRLRDPALRVSGPLGCGKTRLVHEMLGRQAIPCLSLRAQPSRRGSPLAWQIAQELLAPPTVARAGLPRFASEADRRHAAELWQAQRDTRPATMLAALLGQVARASGQAIVVVCDDAEKLEGDDLELVSDLAERTGETVRWWLVGRPGPVPAPFESAPQIWVGALEPEEHRRFALELTRGWSLPTDVLEGWVQVTAGHPFALEEGLIGLARAQRMRRSWGTFSYAGEEGEEPGYRPSSRLIAHLQAEMARLALSPQLLALAVAESSVPVADVEQALGLPADPDGAWAQRATQAGLTRWVPGGWGLGLKFVCPAHARALEYGLATDTARELRHRLGTRLSATAAGSSSAWQAYRLLRGTAGAIQPLLRSAREAGEPTDGDLLAALVEELAALRERGQDRDTELLLLWRLFQTARRLGRIHEFGAELERGLELVRTEPERYLALVNLKAEGEQEAGRYRDAERTLLAALEATRTLPRPERRAALMIRLGRVYEQARRFVEAERLFEEIYPALERQGFRELAATCRYHLGNLARRAHRLAESLGHHGAALEARRDLGLALDTCASLTALGSLSAALGNYPKALQYYDEAVALASAAPSGSRELAFAWLGQARVLGRIGDSVAATPLLRQARELREGRGDRPGEAIARLALAENLFDLEQDERALEEAGRARFDLELLSFGDLVADADHLLGRIQLRRRRFDEARQHLGAAQEAHLRSEQIEAAAFDEAWLLEAALLTDQTNAAERAVHQLLEHRSRLERPELAEQLDYRIYRGLDWLGRREVPVELALPYLERAYEQVLAKAGHLAAERRHRFLLEVPANREIVEAATRLGIAR